MNDLPEIIFHNEPKLSTHEVDGEFNQRRIALVPFIKDFISNHKRFRDKKVGVAFADLGASSLISIIETPEEKLVLRIPLSVSNTFGDAQFLRVWEQAGVKVPYVIEDGTLNGHQYILMEYINAKILKEVYRKGETIKKEIYVELGKILRAMHEPEAVGYGRSMDNATAQAEYLSFRDWFQGSDMQKRITYVQEHHLLGEEHGSLSLAFEILSSHVNTNTKSSYCHNDLGTNNIFATDPPTVFDPDPGFNNGYIDLGRSIFMTLYHDSGLTRAKEQLIKGYFGGKEYDEKALQASILLNAYMKFPYGHKTGNLKQMEDVRRYLITSKHLLGQ